MKATLIRLALCAAAICLFPAAGNAAIFKIEIGGNETSGSGANAIASDAIVMTFDDSVGPNKVRLEIDFKGGAGVDSGAFLNDLVFNVNDALSGITFAWVSGVKVNGLDYDANNNNLSPLNDFDIKFDYPPPTGAAKFFAGLKSTYDIMGTGLTSASFNFKNSGNNFHAYTHINAVDSGDSGKYGGFGQQNFIIPEPGTLTVWSTILAVSLVTVRGRSRAGRRAIQS